MGSREGEWLTLVVLLFSLDRFKGQLVVLVIQLMAFDGFLDRALLEDGQEEVALVGKYSSPLSLLSVWWLWSQYSLFSKILITRKQ